MSKEPQEQLRFTEEEFDMMRGAFANNTALLKLMRKFFIAEVDDNAPMGHLGDIYMSIGTEGKTDAEIARGVIARNMLMSHLNFRFAELEILANRKKESTIEEALRKNLDSSK